MGDRATRGSFVALSLSISVWLSLAIACGSSNHHGVGNDAMPGDAIGGDGGGVCGQDVCAGDACGSGSACGQPVSCAMCRYDATHVDDTTGAATILVATGSGAAPALAVAYGSTVATRAGSAWTTEQIADAMGMPPTGLSGSPVGFALAPDGTRWVAYASDGGTSALRIAHGSGTTWTFDNLGTILDGGSSLAIAGDGTVMAVYAGAANGLEDGIILASLPAGSGATWSQKTIVPTEEVVQALALAPDPNSGGHGIAMVWQDVTTPTVSYTTVTTAGVAGAVELIDDAAPTEDHDGVSLAFDAAGRPHVAYRHEAPDNRLVLHAVRDQGTWTKETIGGDFGTSQVLHVAAGPSGGLAILYDLDTGLYLAQRANGVWLTQPIYSDGGGGDLVYAGDTLEVVRASWRGSIDELVRDGDYPADYAATCAHAASALCTAACACGASCCIDESGGAQGCADPIGNCEKFVGVDLCGDPTRDPSELSSCDAAVATAPTCGSDSAIAAPAACVFP